MTENATLIPTDYAAHLKGILGNRLLSVVRWLYQEDRDRQDFDESADGPTSLFFESGLVLHVEPAPELESLKLSGGDTRDYSGSYHRTDVSKNSFWSQRIGQRVSQIEVFRSKYSSPTFPAEFGLQLTFENDLTVALEYINDEDWPDTLRIRAKIEALDHELVQII